VGHDAVLGRAAYGEQNGSASFPVSGITCPAVFNAVIYKGNELAAERTYNSGGISALKIKGQGSPPLLFYK